jgi:hypothetical protein
LPARGDASGGDLEQGDAIQIHLLRPQASIGVGVTCAVRIEVSHCIGADPYSAIASPVHPDIRAANLGFPLTVQGEWLRYRDFFAINTVSSNGERISPRGAIDAFLEGVGACRLDCIR